MFGLWSVVWCKNVCTPFLLPCVSYGKSITLFSSCPILKRLFPQWSLERHFISRGSKKQFTWMQWNLSVWTNSWENLKWYYLQKLNIICSFWENFSTMQKIVWETVIVFHFYLVWRTSEIPWCIAESLTFSCTTEYCNVMCSAAHSVWFKYTSKVWRLVQMKWKILSAVLK